MDYKLDSRTAYNTLKKQMVCSDIFNQKSLNNNERFHKTVAPVLKTDVLCTIRKAGAPRVYEKHCFKYDDNKILD